MIGRSGRSGVRSVTGTMDAAASLDAASERVPARLVELARIGRSEGGGVTRLPFSEDEAEAVGLFTAWATSAGARVVRDPFGNVFAYRGDWQGDPGVMLGSHLDTVVDGGAYDGALGVLGGLAVLESWELEIPLCIASFRAEEATQVGQGRVGSAVYTNALSLAEAATLFGAVVDPLRGLPIEDVPFPRLYLELHVEQGPRLEAAGSLVGAVTGIAGYSRWQATIVGKADHVGSAAMSERRDALVAAAEIVLEVERVGRVQLDVATVSRLEVAPNRVGVVPARADLTADLRSLSDEAVERAVKDLTTRAAEICGHRDLDLHTCEITRIKTTQFAENVVETIFSAAKKSGYDALRLPSSANHDASNLASVCPAGMVFVPSRGGTSHSPDEFTDPEACQAGARVLGLAASTLAQEINR